jgi:pimeloyl-ACP methyl ester carboxylesterase
MTLSFRHYRQAMVRLVVAVAVASGASVLLGSPASAASPASILSTAQLLSAAPAGEQARHCVDRTLPVRLTDPGPAQYSLWGELCWRGAVTPTTVQLLVPGGSYDHHYWDFPYRQPRYSYVDAATSAGFATFNVDRIGSGRSSAPPSSTVTAHAEAVALHDVVKALRAGQIGGHRFRTVIWVGHSYGSIIGAFELSQYHDVDAFLVTGMLHSLNTDHFAETAYSVEQANQDPKFAGLGLDDGYTSTTPGTRGIFYDPDTVSTGVLATEERTKTFQPALDFAEVTALLTPVSPELSATRQIDVPVLVLNGQNDKTYCGVGFVDCSSPATVLAHEAAYYGPAAHLKVAVIPGTGHSVGLSTTNRLTYATMLAWSALVTRPGDHP